jgi:hypothetical protein
VFVFVVDSVSESVTFNGDRKKDKQKDTDCFASQIPAGMKLLMDLGLKGSTKVFTRMASNLYKMKHFRTRAHGRKETLFKRFKDERILRQCLSHGIYLHGMVVYAVTVIVW